MFAPRAFWIARRRAGFVSALGPPVFTAIAMSFAMRVKTFAIRFHRANIVALRVSKMRPMGLLCAGGAAIPARRISHPRPAAQARIAGAARSRRPAPREAHEPGGERPRLAATARERRSAG